MANSNSILETVTHEEGKHRKDKAVVAYLATYDNFDDAKADYEAIQDLHFQGLIGIYDAAVVSKDASGRVKIHITEKWTEYGAWSGFAVAALAGIFFPPYLIWDLVTGVAAGALIGHFWGGLARSDLKEIAKSLTRSSAAVIVIGRSEISEAFAKSAKHSSKRIQRELVKDADLFTKTLANDVKESRVED